MNMTFGQDLLVHARRGTQPTRVEADGLGDVSFTPSSDHDTNVSYYEARVHPEGSSTIVATKLLGKPSITSSGKIVCSLRAILNSLSAGNYVVIVRAVNANGSTDSTDSNTFTVPLFSE